MQPDINKPRRGYSNGEAVIYDKERKRGYDRTYYLKHREEIRIFRQNHREELSLYQKKLRDLHRPELRENDRKRQQELRKVVLNHYGGKCACCGETTYEFLAIDHINNDGNEHRRKIGGSGKLYSWIRANHFPDGFQVLCHNCNLAKGFYGECPHKRGQNAR
jgi:hypothetical protein